MENETLATLTSLLPAILTAIVTVVTAFFVLRGKSVETEPDADRAIADLQVQLAKAAENMVEPLNLQIEKLKKELANVEKQLEQIVITKNAEIEQVRAIVREQTKELATLKEQNRKLAEDVVTLKQEKERAEQRAAKMERRLNQIKDAVDTGPLGSGVHKIPKTGE